MIVHAFFKALLFLGAGSVIHGVHDEQDMRRMGGLRKYMPITAGTFIVGWLAIAGVFPFAGLLGEGRDPRQGVVPRRLRALGGRPRRRGAHRVLHDPPGVARLLRRRALAARREHMAPDDARTRTTHAHSRTSRRGSMLIPLFVLAVLAMVGGADRPAVRAPAHRPARPVARADPAHRARDHAVVVRRRRSCCRRSRSSIAIVGIVVGRARLPQRARRRRRRPRRASAWARFAKVFDNGYYLDVGLARFVSGPVTAFATVPERRRRPRRHRRRGQRHRPRVPARAAAGCAGCRPAWCATTRSAIVFGAVLLLVFVATRVTL